MSLIGPKNVAKCRKKLIIWDVKVSLKSDMHAASVPGRRNNYIAYIDHRVIKMVSIISEITHHMNHTKHDYYRTCKLHWIQTPLRRHEGGLHAVPLINLRVISAIIWNGAHFLHLFMFQGTLLQHLKEHMLHGDIRRRDVMLYYTTVHVTLFAIVLTFLQKISLPTDVYAL